MEVVYNTTARPVDENTGSANTPRKKKNSWLLIPVILLLAFVVLTGALVVTRPNEYTVIKQFGAVVRIVDEPGASLKLPFIQTTQKIPNTLMLYDLAVSDVITSDKKSMIADCFVTWHVTDPQKFIESLSASVANAEFRINTVVYNSLKTTISSMTQEAVISGRDGRLAEAILANCDDTFGQYGINITAVETKTLDMPAENKAAVYQRMISEREKIAAQYTADGEYEAQKTRNAANKESEILLSEAQAQAGNDGAGAITKEQFDKMTVAERTKLYKEQPEKYNEFVNQN